MESHALLLGLSLVIVLGMAAQWVAWRIRVPAILLLLAAGAAAGPGTQAWFGGDKWFDPDKLLGGVLGPVVSLSVAVILFEGGLTLKLAELTHVGRVVRNLVTVGAATTFAVTAVAAHLVLRMPWPLAVLLGAVLIVTGPTVIGPLLRHVRPVGRVTPILKWEGIVIDPLGAVLAVLVFNAIRAEHAADAVATSTALSHAVHAVGHVVKQTVDTAPAVAVTVARTALSGLVVGLAAATLLVVLLWRYWMADHLANPFTLALVIAAYTGAELWSPDSGLLAVTVMGIALANQRLAPFKHIHEFKESLSVLLVSGLFILLSARLDAAQLQRLSWRTPAFVAVLIVVGRPAAVWLSTVRSHLSWRERAFLSGMAPRGIVAAAVTGVFALRLKEANVAGADQMVPVAFAVIVCTVVVYGLSAIPLARGLGLAKAGPAGFLVIGANPLARTVAAAVRDAGQRVVLVDTNAANVAAARLAGLDVLHESAASERAMEKLEGTGIGVMLALTPNEEVNTLAAVFFGRVFGRSNVYQLATEARRSTGRGRTSADLRGRVLFDAGTTFATLSARFAAGTVTGTTLTDTFTIDDYRVRFGRDAVPLFVIGADGEWTVWTADHPPEPTPGQTVYAVVSAGPREPVAEPTGPAEPVAIGFDGGLTPEVLP